MNSTNAPSSHKQAAFPDGAEPEVILKFFLAYRSYEEHENLLLNHRTTWLVAIESGLIAACGFTLNKSLEAGNPAASRFIVGLGLMGIAIALWSFISIMTAIVAQREIRKTWRLHFSKSAAACRLPNLAGGGSEFATMYGGLLAGTLPFLITLLWLYILWLVIG